eukprot:TRINITY_DN46198_c0_g1_i1.p1 TRINITY_DN46198_c0_g1~~TRINITY_DN46198_c0_g1_i1.p1  ORF type:complete len:630 (-),score=48.79 TRINITY_DN46198_c0_g1_i1:86-1975(-)
MPPRSLQVEGREVHGSPLLGPRRKACCTDLACCFVFVLCIALFVVYGIAGMRHGRPEMLQRFTSGRDYQGRLCGFDHGVERFKLTYFTLHNGTDPILPGNWTADARALLRPVCTAMCPHAVPGKTQRTVLIREVGLCAADMYPNWCTWYGADTVQLANYCVDLNVFDGGMDWEHLLQQLRACTVMLCVAPAIAIFLGFVFLNLVNHCGACFLWAAALVSIAVPAISGCIVYTQARQDELDADAAKVDRQKHVAYGLWAIALVLVLLAACFVGAIKTVAAVLKATSQFLQDVPSQMLQPLILSLIQLAFLAVWVCVFVSVASISLHEGFYRDCLQAGDIYCLQWDWNSTSRNCSLAFLVIMLYWFVNFLHALSYFGTSYAVGAWYFAPVHPETGKKLPAEGGHTCCDFRLSLRAVMHGLVHHGGSLAAGAFVVTICRILRMLLCWAQKSDGSTSANPVVRAVRRCTDCVADCVARFIEFVSVNAYVEVALRGTNFMAAAQRSCAMTVSRPALFALVSRVACALRLLGIAIMTGGTAYGVALLLSWRQPERVTSEEGVLVLAGFIGFVVGEVMMHPLSASARACLHCFCLDDERAEAGGFPAANTPLPLQRFLREHENHSESRERGCCCCG